MTTTLWKPKASADLDAPEVGGKPLSLPGSHRSVVERRCHSLRHSFVSELHPALGEVTAAQTGLSLPVTNQTVWKYTEWNPFRLIGQTYVSNLPKYDL